MFINSVSCVLTHSVLFIFRGDSHIFLAVMHFLAWWALQPISVASLPLPPLLKGGKKKKPQKTF